jgi:hypothetical protein
MEKTHVTHVNDGFTFLGHRLIPKRGPRGTMHVVSTIPHDKAKRFRRELTDLLSTQYGRYTVEVIEQLNRKLIGWGQFYRFTDHVAIVFSHIDRAVFWKLAHWLGRKYRSRTGRYCSASVSHRYPANPKPGCSTDPPRGLTLAAFIWPVLWVEASSGFDGAPLR